MTSNPKYTKRYFEKRRRLAERSANIIVPLLLSKYEVSSVVDLGCADGVWLSAFCACGVEDVLGIDGPWIKAEDLQISANKYVECNLALEMPVIDRQFGLACSIEVIEHIPDELGKRLVKTLTELAPVVLFSAAVPFQGGTGHINERRQSYWLNVFQLFGYECIDLIRAELWDNSEVNVIYRQNMFVYVDYNFSRDSLLRKWRVAEHSKIDVIHPDLYEMRMEQAQRKPERPIGSVRSASVGLLKAISHRIRITR